MVTQNYSQSYEKRPGVDGNTILKSPLEEIRRMCGLD